MKQKNLILMVVAVGCGLVAAFLTTQINAKPKVEMIEVLVAARDLPVGTTLAPAELEKLVETKPMAKDVLPPQFVTTREELVGKRLSRPVLKGETFSSAALSKGPVVTLPPGKDLYSLAMNARDGAGGFVGPGSKVDILAALMLGNQLKTFPLLVDMHVVAVNQALSYEPGKSGFPDMSMISLAVDQEEALLLSLAEKRGCTLKLLLRREGKPKDKEYNMAAVRKLLEDSKHPATSRTTEDRNGGESGDVPPVPAIGAVPTEKKEKDMVKVWIAKANIESNTTLTADLIKEKFAQEERPREYAEGACADVAEYHTKALVHGISKGQYLTYFMLGEQGPKPAPQDLGIANLPKGGPSSNPQPRPQPKVEVKPRATRDIALHTPSGSVVFRYMEMKPGEWKLLGTLTPEQAARPSKESTASEKPSGEPKQPAPDASKLD